MKARIAIYLGLIFTAFAAAATAPVDQQKGSNQTPLDTGIRDTMTRVWRSHILAPTEKESAAKLDRAVQMLKTIRIERSNKFTGTKAAGKQQRSARTEEPAAEPTRHSEQITSEMLSKIKKLPKKAIADPAGLAEILCLGGHHDVAAKFHDIAAESATDGDEKAWLLFRSANCLRRSDSAAALQRYRKLLAECPDSFWGPLARAQAQIIEWYQTNNIADLLDKTKKEASK